MPSLSPTDQALLTKAVQAATQACNDGTHPTAAVVKVAFDLNLGPGGIRAVAHSLNTGLQLAQMYGEKTAAARFAPFPIADADQAIDTVWGNKQAASSCHDYKKKPHQLGIGRKPAAKPSMQQTIGKAAAVREEAKTIQKVSLDPRERRRQEMRHQFKLAAEIKKLASLFHEHAATSPLRQLKQAAVACLGQPAAALFSLAVKEAGWSEDYFTRLKQPALNGPVPASHPILKQAAVAMQAAQAAATFNNQFLEAPACTLPSLLRKRASATTIAMGNILSGALTGYPRPIGAPAGAVESKLRELDDPLHDQQLRAIRAAGMLSQMMGDQKDTISTKKPAEVAQAYSELARLAPRGSEQPAIVGPWLRRRLQGHTEPFEASQLADTEKSLRMTSAPMSGAGQSQQV